MSKLNIEDVVAEARKTFGDINVNLTVEAHGSDVIEIGSFNLEEDDLLLTVRTKIHEAYDSLPTNAHKLNARLNANFFFTKDTRLYIHTHLRIKDFMDACLDHAELMKKISILGVAIGVWPKEEEEEVLTTTPTIPIILITSCDSSVDIVGMVKVLRSEIGMSLTEAHDTALSIKSHLAPTKEDPLALNVPPFVLSLPEYDFTMGEDVAKGLKQIAGLRFETSWLLVGPGADGLRFDDSVLHRAAKRLHEIEMLKALANPQ